MNEMHNNSLRTSKFKKDNSLELILQEINSLIEPLATEYLNAPQKPIILIMGCARSGSTLLLQYLASLGVFSYPSNLIARFYKNPYLGIRIQQALVEHDSMNQIGLNETTAVFKSDLGKTYGANAPSEFWYFWKEYFKFGLVNKLLEEEIQKIDSQKFLHKLSAFEILTSKPLVMKGMILNWDIPFLHTIYPRFIFINIKREILSNANSLLESRKKFFNDISRWYSFKPEEYINLKALSPEEQVVGQVVFTQNAIEKGLKEIPIENKIDITYEEFCANPYNVLKTIKRKIELLGNIFEIPKNNNLVYNAKRASPSKALKDAYLMFKNP